MVNIYKPILQYKSMYIKCCNFDIIENRCMCKMQKFTKSNERYILKIYKNLNMYLLSNTANDIVLVDT